MSSVRWLSEIAALTDSSIPAEEAVESSLRLLQDGLEASDSFLVYGDNGTFGCFSSSNGHGLSDVALWLINRDLVARRLPCAFDVRDGRVENFRDANGPREAQYAAALIPMVSPAGEMVIVRGSWEWGFGRQLTKALRAALPALALILGRRLDADRAGRRHRQLGALADITSVFSEEQDQEVVLASIAGTIAAVTGIDYVSIDLINPDGTVRLRCLESSRQGTEELRERWKNGASKPDPIRDMVVQSHKPMFFPDAQNDERIPENGRAYFVRTLLVSTGVLPLLAKDDVLGVLSLASHKPLEFSQSEVEMLEGMASQAATAVKGIQLYQELAESRRELQRVNEQLAESMSVQHHLARTDPLTGVPNRRYLEEALATECARADRYGQTLSLVMVDIDHLKKINDEHSHQKGDEMIRYAARLARESCRQADVVARYGGDEFVFLLPATTLQNAASLAERFRLRLAEEAVSDGTEELVPLTVSLGVVEWNGMMTGPGSLLEAADQALYAAKSGGRNQTMIATATGARAAA